MNKNILMMAHVWVPSFLVVAFSLSGCSSVSTSSFTVQAMRVTPEHAVTITAENLPQYPPLHEILTLLDAQNGTYDGKDIPYPYDKGLAVVKSLQAQLPDVTWPHPNVVNILYKGRPYQVVASPPHEGEV